MFLKFPFLLKIILNVNKIKYLYFNFIIVFKFVFLYHDFVLQLSKLKNNNKKNIFVCFKFNNDY